MNMIPVAICFCAGALLLLLETMLPGFGLPGVSGVVLLGAGTVLLGMMRGTAVSMGALLMVLAVVGLAAVLFWRSAAKGRMRKSKLFLHVKDLANEPVSREAAIAVGDRGEAMSILRPSGVAKFQDRRVNVVTEGSFIPQGAEIEVVRVEGTRVVVESVLP